MKFNVTLLLVMIGIVLVLQIAIVSGYDCRAEGCPPDYRCMANGECTPLSIKRYCEDHGKPFYVYDEALLSRNCSDILNGGEGGLCLQCKGDYELRKSVSDIENIIYGITAGIAILMLVLNGFRFMTAADPDERNNAKKALMYVIIAVIIVAVTTKFIEYLLL